MIDLVMIAVTLFVALAALVAWRLPTWRESLETPKRRILEEERRFGHPID